MPVNVVAYQKKENVGLVSSKAAGTIPFGILQNSLGSGDSSSYYQSYFLLFLSEFRGLKLHFNFENTWLLTLLEGKDCFILCSLVCFSFYTLIPK